MDGRQMRGRTSRGTQSRQALLGKQALGIPTESSEPVSDGVTPYQDPPDATLRGRWLLAARVGWIAAATLTLGLVIGGLGPPLIGPI
jgi:hypothetical protein